MTIEDKIKKTIDALYIEYDEFLRVYYMGGNGKSTLDGNELITTIKDELMSCTNKTDTAIWDRIAELDKERKQIGDKWENCTNADYIRMDIIDEIILHLYNLLH